jgi:ubiquinone/menaquinone biosynthesis C-methylase UbiE
VKLDFRDVYTNLLTRVRTTQPNDEAAARLTIGGDFELFSELERELLVQHGLEPGHDVIDVGCGSGRLTKGLAPYLKGSYLGTDVVPKLLAFARTRAPSPAWRFEITEGLSIPAGDASADLVCFFSVFTHILHEQTYVYLREARRVLRPGGRIVFSFTEFTNPNHWWCFEAAVREIGLGLPLYVFVSREAIDAWAQHLDLTIERVYGGDEPCIALATPLTSQSGQQFAGKVPFGQSVCVLRKR